MIDYKRTRNDVLDRKRKLEIRLDKIHGQRSRLQSQLEVTQRELAALDQILDALDFRESDAAIEGEPSGMADHIRRRLQQTTAPLLPTQIRDFLMAVGIRGSSPKNLLIGVHNVISRLEVFLETTEINGRPAYRWKRNIDGGVNENIAGSQNSRISRTPKREG